MREIGKIDNELDASVFRDFLFNHGIDGDIERNTLGTWGVWVHDEDRIDEATELIHRFLKNPQDPFFVAGADGADARRAAREKEERESAKKVRSRGDLVQTYGWAGVGRVTVILIALSVVATLLIQFGSNQEVVNKLAIAETFELAGRGVVYKVNLAEIRAGEVWRLVTPIFMHFSIIHILFNMMWLRDLGSMIEQVRGARFLLLFLLVSAVASNLGQFYMSGPAFGGMSGVVYGLLGFVWMQSRFNPRSGFVLHSVTVQMMLIWFVLCLTGVIGNIANTAHAVGLAVGVLWGFLDARLRAR